RVRNFEVAFRTKGGQARTGLGSAELIEVSGELCSLAVVADITELKQAEEGRKASDNRFKQFFASLPEYCYITSPSGEILDANAAACNALGYSREELLGKPLSAIYASESFSKLVDLLAKWKDTGTLHNEEMVVLTREGRRRTILLNAGSVRDTNGNLVQSTSVQIDVTDRKRIQETLRES